MDDGEFANRELKRALIILSLTGFHFLIPDFPGDISSLSYLIKCSHVPTPKSQGNFGCQEGSPMRLNQVAGILAALPHICHSDTCDRTRIPA